MSRHSIIAFPLILHLCLLTIHCNGSAIVFATSADLTTSSGPTVVAYHNGVRAAFDEYNNATGGGYRGVPLQFIALDDQYNATRAVENTRMLLRDHNVTALFAPSGTDSVISSLPLARAAGVPIMFPATGAQAIRTPFDPFVINNMASYDDQVRVMIKYSVATLMHSRISVVYVNDGFGRPPAFAGISFLKQIGFDPHSVASYERNSYDVTGALNSLLSKPKLPQTVVFVGLCIEAGLLIKGYQQKTKYPTTFILISVCSLPSLANTLGPNADYSNILAIRTTPDPNVASALTERFHSAMTNYAPAGAFRDHMAMQGYLNGLVVAQILSRHDSRQPVTPSSFMSVVYSTNMFSTYDVTIGPYYNASSISPGCNQGMRQVWMVKATASGWESISNEGVETAVAPWPASCFMPLGYVKSPIIWANPSVSHYTSPTSDGDAYMRFVAGVKAAISFTNTNGGGVQGRRVELLNIDTAAPPVPPWNPAFNVTTQTWSSYRTNVMDRFLDEYVVTGIVALPSDLRTTEQVQAFLKTIRGLPVVGAMGGSQVFHSSQLAQLVPHRSPWLIEFYALLDHLFITRSHQRVGLFCLFDSALDVTHDVCSQAQAAFNTLATPPKFVHHLTSVPNPKELTLLLFNVTLMDEERLEGLVQSVVLVCSSVTQLQSFGAAFAMVAPDMPIALASYINARQVVTTSDWPVIVQADIVPPTEARQSCDKCAQYFADLDQVLLSETWSIYASDSHFAQGFASANLLAQGVSRTSFPFTGSDFLRAISYSQQFQVYMMPFGPYSDPSNVKTCRQGSSAVFITDLVPSSPSQRSVSIYNYPSCGPPESVALRHPKSKCAIRQEYGRGVWDKFSRARRIHLFGAWFFTVALVLSFGSVLLSALVMLIVEARKKKRSLIAASSMSLAQQNGAAANTKKQAKGPLIRDSSANRVALVTIFADAYELCMLFMYGEVPWIGNVLDTVYPPWRSVGGATLAPIASAFALLWIIIALVVLHQPTLSKLQRKAPTLISLGTSYLPIVGNLGLVLVVQGLVGIFRVACTNSECFLFHDCHGNAWDGPHLATATVSMVVLVIYLPMYALKGLALPPSPSGTLNLLSISVVRVVLCSQVWQRIEPDLDLGVDARMNVTSNVIRISLIFLPIVFPRVSLTPLLINVTLILVLIILVAVKNPCRVPWYPIVKLTALSLCLATAVVVLVTHVFGVVDPLFPTLALLCAWAATLVSGLVAFRRRHARIFMPTPHSMNRVAKIARMFQKRFNPGSKSSTSLSRESSEEDHMAVLTKASARTMTQWIVDLEQQGSITSAEASWLLQDITRGPTGIMHHLFVASCASFDHFQHLMLEGCALLVVQGLIQSSLDAAGAPVAGVQKLTKTLPRTSSTTTSPTRSLQRGNHEHDGPGSGGLRISVEPPASRRPSRCLPVPNLPQVQDVSDSDLSAVDGGTGGAGDVDGGKESTPRLPPGIAAQESFAEQTGSTQNSFSC